MDGPDRDILAELESGLPLADEPFGEIGKKLGLSEAEVLERLRRLKDDGIIRRVRARVDQRKLGIAANAIVGWIVPETRREEVGHLFAEHPGVTHCYERRPVPGRWEYSVYTVHHRPDRNAVEEEVMELARAAGIDDYTIIFSTKELKRVPAVRIRENRFATGHPLFESSICCNSNGGSGSFRPGTDSGEEHIPATRSCQKVPAIVQDLVPATGPALVPAAVTAAGTNPDIEEKGKPDT